MPLPNKDTILDSYNVDCAPVNNANAVRTVNNWVSEKTAGKIKELINSSDFLAYGEILFMGEYAYIE